MNVVHGCVVHMCCGGVDGAEPNKGNVRWMCLQEERGDSELMGQLL